MNPTITEFLNTIEVMRKTYPFKNDQTYITSTVDVLSEKHDVIHLCTIDNDNGVEVCLKKKIVRSEWNKV